MAKYTNNRPQSIPGNDNQTIANTITMRTKDEENDQITRELQENNNEAMHNFENTPISQNEKKGKLLEK